MKKLNDFGMFNMTTASRIDVVRIHSGRASVLDTERSFQYVTFDLQRLCRLFQGIRFRHLDSWAEEAMCLKEMILFN